VAFTVSVSVSDPDTGVREATRLLEKFGARSVTRQRHRNGILITASMQAGDVAPFLAEIEKVGLLEPTVANQIPGEGAVAMKIEIKKAP
jgi:hypothetical protein